MEFLRVKPLVWHCTYLVLFEFLTMVESHFLDYLVCSQKKETSHYNPYGTESDGNIVAIIKSTYREWKEEQHRVLDMHVWLSQMELQISEQIFS